MSLIFVEKSFTIQWLTLSRSNDSSICYIGRHNNWLTKVQSRMCIEFFPSLIQAAIITISTCQDMFNFRRWNCSNIISAPNLTPDLITGTREQGIVYTISSAALLYTLSRNCAQGSIYNCPCHKNSQVMPSITVKPSQIKNFVSNNITNLQFKWAGCNNYIKWATKITRNFVNSPNKRVYNNKSLINKVTGESKFLLFLSLMNHHNNKVGRKVVERTVTINCQCHGISGSCSVRTCWKALPNVFNDNVLLNTLTLKYRNAVEMFQSHQHNQINNKTNVRNNIIYFTKSPDYCTKDLRTGSQGTIGRQCNDSAIPSSLSLMSQNSCTNMCCGRGYISYINQYQERCNCKYYWCCYVKCKTCHVNVKINKCV
ncbi:protein Wnt-11b-2-like [Lycorma delicatula]|uniref:protein Wnt-11b-2-like n=1 Tax=Lycorma delicatula TaxID=130591 RepID=UPI003F51998F